MLHGSAPTRHGDEETPARVGPSAANGTRSRSSSLCACVGCSGRTLRGGPLRTAVVVFTRDLRVADNPACRGGGPEPDAVVPLFVGTHRCRSRAPSDPAGVPVRLTARAGRSRPAGRPPGRQGAPGWTRSWAPVSRPSAGTVDLAEDVSAYAAARHASLRRAAAGTGIRCACHPGVTAVPTGRRGAGRRAVPARSSRRTPALARRPGGGVLPLRHGSRWPTRRLRGAGSLPRLGDLPPAACGDVPGGEVERAARLTGLGAGATWPSTPAPRRPGRERHLPAVGVPPFRLLSAGPGGRMRARPGGAAFVRQVAWRDFFYQLLASRPDAARRTTAPRRRLARRPGQARRLAQGRTGYPSWMPPCGNWPGRGSCTTGPAWSSPRS